MRVGGYIGRGEDGSDDGFDNDVDKVASEINCEVAGGVKGLILHYWRDFSDRWMYRQW